MAAERYQLPAPEHQRNRGRFDMGKLKGELQTALMTAMKARDSQRRNAIRLLQSAIKQFGNRQPQPNWTTTAVLRILQREEAKQRRETIQRIAKRRGALTTPPTARYRVGAD